MVAPVGAAIPGVAALEEEEDVDWPNNGLLVEPEFWPNKLEPPEDPVPTDPKLNGDGLFAMVLHRSKIGLSQKNSPRRSARVHAQVNDDRE